MDPNIRYIAPQIAEDAAVARDTAIGTLNLGTSYVCVTVAGGKLVRLNQTPDETFLLASEGIMTEFNDAEFAILAAENLSAGRLTTKQVLEGAYDLAVEYRAEAAPPTS